MKWSDLTLKERKQIYDAVRAENPNASYFDIKSQFDLIPEYEDGGKRIVDYVNSNNVNFVNRLKNPFRQTINDWETQYINKYVPNVNDKFELVYNSKATHKLSAWEGEEGRGLIVPNVQEINGKLVDFTRPPYNDREALRQAFKTGDFVETDTYNDAEWYTQNYKKYYPSFEDGGKKIVPPKELGLTPGTPEYYKRQQQISGKAELVQPEAYVTPVGYIKDAITTAEELEKGNYGNAAVSTLMNVIPWGVGKGLRKIKSRVSNTLNTPIEIHSSMFDEYPSILAEKARSKTSKNKKKVKEESDYDSEFSEVIRRDRNIKKYEKEINKTIEDAILPDKKTYELVKGIDTAYGTDYLDAYKRIAARDMTNRGKYIKYAELPGNKNAKISRVRDVQDYGPVVDDYVITIDPLQYLPGTANHELGHLADQLASDANNRYLTYLLDEGNIMGPGELRSKGINVGSDMQSYLLDPSESKSHMLHLKRALVNEGKIHDWSSKVNQNTIEDFLFDPRNTGVVNNANKLQYNMYRNKSRFVDRINNLTPMEFITPLLLPVAGYEINKE